MRLHTCGAFVDRPFLCIRVWINDQGMHACSAYSCWALLTFASRSIVFPGTGGLAPVPLHTTERKPTVAVVMYDATGFVSAPILFDAAICRTFRAFANQVVACCLLTVAILTCTLSHLCACRFSLKTSVLQIRYRYSSCPCCHYKCAIGFVCWVIMASGVAKVAISHVMGRPLDYDGRVR